MLRRTFVRSLMACGAAVALAQGAHAQQKVTINVMTAGDQNMVDYVTDYLGPLFEKQNPGVSVRSVGTGPGVRPTSSSSPSWTNPRTWGPSWRSAKTSRRCRS